MMSSPSYSARPRRWTTKRAAKACCLGVALLAVALLISNCDRKPHKQPASLTATPMPSNPFLTVEPKLLDDHRVQLTIGTNLPMPIKVATSIDLRGQRATDTYIGYQEFISLTGAATLVVLDTLKAEKPLPSARYDVAVDFFPMWGAQGNPSAAGAPHLHAESQVQLAGGGGSPAEASLLNDRQRWVMETVVMNMPWDKARFQKRLGKSEKGRSDLSPLHDAYYYPGADMTLMVNRVRNEVTTWRKGNGIVPPNVTRADFERKGLKWPLTVNSGYLACDSSAVSFATSEGEAYAVNGTARSRFKPIDPIWAFDDKMLAELKAGGGGGGFRPRINIGDLIDQGLKLCR